VRGVCPDIVGPANRETIMGKPKGRKIRILLVDDHPVSRRGLEVSLARDAGMSVVASASTLEEAARASVEPPDVLVIDTGSITLIRETVSRFPDAKVVVFTSADSAEFVREAARCGVRGFLLTLSTADELIRAVKVVHAGGVHFSAPVSGALVSEYAENVDQSNKTRDLTPRECEVLRLIAEGHTSRDIAAILRVSVRTVHSHREHISQKLGVRSVAGLTRFAMVHGIIPPR
jgi:DNA-binding NarL/FixJ family response regulator